MPNAVKVGIFATICLVVLALLIWNIEGLNPFAPEGRRIDAIFDSVAGLDDKASVRVAGVRIGRVDGVGLEGQRARISLLLEQQVPLTEGTYARIANLGLLGEKYVELVPGSPDAPPLPPDAVLRGVTPPTIDDAISQLSEIGESIQRVTGSLAEGDLGGNMNRLVAEIEATSREIRSLVAENRANVGSAVANFDRVGATLAEELPRLSAQMNRALDQIATLVEENRGQLGESIGNVRELTSRLQTSADNLNRITEKIASGEGTIGRLVNSDEAYDEVVSTLDSIQGGVETLSGTIGAVNRFRIDLDLNGYYLAQGGDDEGSGEDEDESRSRTAFSLDIDPQDGKRLYRVGIANTPDGRLREKTQEITVTNPDGTTETTTIATVTREQERVITGLFGYRAPNDLRLWAGLIENSGGAQVEYPFRDQKLWLSFEAFDFNRPGELDPHLRLTGRWHFHPNLYLVGGYDDPLERNAVFVGGGIRWNDENIKYLLGAAAGAF